MITSFIWAQIVARSPSSYCDRPDRRRYVSSSCGIRAKIAESVLHAFWFLIMSAGIAFFALVSAVLLDSGSPELVSGSSSVRSEGVFHTLVGAFVFGVGLASVIWSLSSAEPDMQDPYEEDERMR